MKKMLYGIFILLIIIVVGGIIFINSEPFGKLPTGKRLERIKKSPNYRDGKFQNLSETPQMTSDKSYPQMIYDFFFKKNENAVPKKKVPAEKTDLKNLPNNALVWLGHSSYFMKMEQKNILIDPVFHSASPFSFMIKPFEAEYNYSSNDIPNVDLLIITHDHWDHLDYLTMKELKGKINKILCPLGVGEHLEYWGFSPEQITELDWNEVADIEDFKFTCLPTRHFSGRGLKPTQTLWASFMLQTAGKTIYIGGDSGYDTHFAKMGKAFPNIDLAILENGQYNEDWKYIHLLPEDLHQAMKDLGAKRYFTGHHSKFQLGKHDWDEPIKNLEKISKEDSQLTIEMPKIGKVVAL